MGTFSKKLVRRCAIGFIVCPRAFRPVLIGIKRTIELWNVAALQHVLAEFLDRGYLRASSNKTLPEYRMRRDALEQALSRHLPRA